MNQCENGSLLLQLVDQWNFIVCATSVIAAILFNDKRWFVFSIITVVAYINAVYFHCDIKIFDSGYIYRYAFWALNDLIWILFLFIMWNKGNIYHHQYAVAIIIAVLVECTQLFRFIDRHFFELAYSSEFYKTTIPTLNSILALCCWLPIKNKIWSK